MGAWPIVSTRAGAGLISRIWKQTNADDCFDLAAQISFYFSLSLLPFCLVLAVIVGQLPSTLLWKSFAAWIVTYLPSDSQQIIFSTILGLTSYSVSFFSFGLIMAVWSASAGFVSLMESLSAVCGCKETRSYWRKYALAATVTLVSVVFILGAFGLVAFTNWGYGRIMTELGSSPSRAVWRLGRWILTLGLLWVAIDVINFALPSAKRGWQWITPGTAFDVVALSLSTAGFNLYFKHFPEYPRLYGALGGFIILMLWIYTATLILLIGAETDCEIAALSGATRATEAVSEV